MMKTVFSLALTAALTLMSVGSVAAQSDPSVGACGWIVGTAGGRAQFQVFGDLDEQGQPTGFVIFRDPSINFRLRATSTQITSIVRDGCLTTMTGTATTTEGRDSFHIVVNTGSFLYNNAAVLGGGEIQADGATLSRPITALKASWPGTSAGMVSVTRLGLSPRLASHASAPPRR